MSYTYFETGIIDFDFEKAKLISIGSIAECSATYHNHALFLPQDHCYWRVLRNVSDPEIIAYAVHDTADIAKCLANIAGSETHPVTLIFVNLVLDSAVMTDILNYIRNHIGIVKCLYLATDFISADAITILAEWLCRECYIDFLGINVTCQAAWYQPLTAIMLNCRLQGLTIVNKILDLETQNYVEATRFLQNLLTAISHNQCLRFLEIASFNTYAEQFASIIGDFLATNQTLQILKLNNDNLFNLKPLVPGLAKNQCLLYLDLSHNSISFTNGTSSSIVELCRAMAENQHLYILRIQACMHRENLNKHARNFHEMLQSNHSIRNIVINSEQPMGEYFREKVKVLDYDDTLCHRILESESTSERVCKMTGILPEELVRTAHYFCQRHAYQKKLKFKSLDSA